MASKPSPYAVFKPWFVKRPNGGCLVLFPLNELDTLVDAAIEASGDSQDTEIERLKNLWSIQQDRALRAEDEAKSLGLDLKRLREENARLRVRAERLEGLLRECRTFLDERALKAFIDAALSEGEGGGE